MRKLLVSLVLLVGASAWAQQPEPGCQIANALFGALFKAPGNAIPCGPAGANTGNAAQPQSPNPVARAGESRGMNNELDTADNLAQLLETVRARYAQLDPEKRNVIASDEFCLDAMKVYSRYQSILNSGYDQLQRRCIVQSEPIRRAFFEQSNIAQKKAMEANDRERAAQEKARVKKEADEVNAVVADLRSGKKIPTNCSQYMVTKGANIDSLNASVMVAAYQAPTGVGPFLGAVDQINGDTLVLSGKLPGLLQLVARPPANSILEIDKSARIFNGGAIRMGGVVEGFATQIGTRSVKLVNGSTSTVAVMRAVCIAGNS